MLKQISSTQNTFIKELKALKSKKGRRDGLFLCEGEKCALEALEYANTEAVLVTDENDPVAKSASEKNIDVYIVTDAVMEAVSDTKSQQGAIAVVRKKEYSLPSPGGLFVALENVSDPQNVGTIIRTADAAGAKCVILSKECADYTSPKAVRAAMGSVFHIPIITAESLFETVSALRQSGMEIIGTHLKGTGSLQICESSVVIIGSEARGMSDELSSLCTQLYKIPMRGKAESLNAAVAAGIVIYKIADSLL